MAEIANSPVFTNSKFSSGTSGMIQNFIKQFTDDEEPLDDISYSQNDDNGMQVMYFIPEQLEQVPGFNLTYNVDGPLSGEVTFHQNDCEIIPEVQQQINLQDISNVDNTR